MAELDAENVELLHQVLWRRSIELVSLEPREGANYLASFRRMNAADDLVYTVLVPASGLTEMAAAIEENARLR